MLFHCQLILKHEDPLWSLCSVILRFCRNLVSTTESTSGLGEELGCSRVDVRPLYFHWSPNPSPSKEHLDHVQKWASSAPECPGWAPVPEDNSDRGTLCPPPPLLPHLPDLLLLEDSNPFSKTLTSSKWVEQDHGLWCWITSLASWLDS